MLSSLAASVYQLKTSQGNFDCSYHCKREATQLDLKKKKKLKTKKTFRPKLLLGKKPMFLMWQFQIKFQKNLEPPNKWIDFFGLNYTSKKVNAIIHLQSQENRCKLLLVVHSSLKIFFVKYFITKWYFSKAIHLAFRWEENCGGDRDSLGQYCRWLICG